MAYRTCQFISAAGVAVGLLLAAPQAVAQKAAAEEERRLTPDERARELYLRGDRLYAEGSYDEAVTAFEKSYALSQRPALLYDMANALERLGRYEEALHRLNQYVPHAPEHQRNAVLKRIRSLEQRAEHVRRQERPDAPATPTESVGSRAVEPAPPPAEIGPSAPILGYAVGGAGLASIGVGVLFGLSASSAREDAEAQCSDNGSQVLCPESVEGLLSDADSRALVADIAVGIGLVAVGVGVYLVLNHDEASGATTELRTAAAPGGGRVSFVTTF